MPPFIIPENFHSHLNFLTQLKSSSFEPSTDILVSDEFQNWLFDISENAEKTLVFLVQQGIKLNPFTVIKAIKYHVGFEFFQFIIENSHPIPFSCFLECLAILEQNKSDKKNKTWSLKIQKFLIENAERYVVADSSVIAWQCCFHNNRKYVSIKKNLLLELNYSHARYNQTHTVSFDCNPNMELFDTQTTLSLLQLSFYFELQAHLILKMLSKEFILNHLYIDSFEILQQLKTKPDYFEHLDSILEFIEPNGLKSYLLFQVKNSVNFNFLEKNFLRPNNFWKTTLRKSDKRISSEYQRIWSAIEKSNSVIPELKDELQTVINFPQSNAISFEEWLYCNTKIAQSLLIIKKWGIHLHHVDSNPNNLFLLGIYHQQPIFYFRFLIEKLNYNIYVSDYFNGLACMNALIAQGMHCEWLAVLWEYMVEKGGSFIQTTARQHYSYHFNVEENAILILSEATNNPYLQVIYLDEKKVTKHQEFFVHDYSKLKLLDFKYFFESRFIIEQVNAEIILQSIFLFLEKEKQLGFMQKLQALIKNEALLNEHLDYKKVLSEPIIIKLNEQQVKKSLDEYLQHHINRELYLDKKWHKLIDTCFQAFEAKISVVEEKYLDDYQLVLKQFLSSDNPQMKTIIFPHFKAWLCETDNPFDNILALVEKKYQLDDYINHDISILGLAVLNHYPMQFIKMLVENKAFKCPMMDFLHILAFLEMHLHDTTTHQWALELRHYFIENRFTIVLIEDLPADCEYFFYDNYSSLVIYDHKNNLYCLIEKNGRQTALKRSFFQLNYATPKQIQYDSILQLAIKLQAPLDFMDLLITHKNIKETSINPDKHMYYELLKHEHSSPKYYKDALEWVINKFFIFDTNENNLLHFLVLHDRTDLIEKHFSELLPFIDQINQQSQSPITQILNCSRETFDLLIKMEPTIPDLNQFYLLFINPEYTETLINAFPRCYFNQTLKSGMNLIQEMFCKHPDLISIIKLILSVRPDFIEDASKDNLLFLSINQETRVDQFKTLHEMISFSKEKLDVFHFIKTCEFKNLELADYLFKTQMLEVHFSNMIQNQAVLEFFLKKNIIQKQPQLVNLFSCALLTLQENYQKEILKQILAIAKSKTYWLAELDDFEHLLLLSLKLSILQPNEQCKSGENILFFVEHYCYKNKDYALLKKLTQKQYKLDFNKKNASQDHIIMRIFKEEDGLSRVVVLLSECSEVELQLYKLNSRGDNLLDIAIETQNSSFVDWCFSKYDASMSVFINEDLRKKTSRLIELTRKNPALFSEFCKYFNQDNWQIIQHLSDIKHYLQMNHQDLLTPEKREVHFNWHELKTFLLNASAKQILNLQTTFKHEILPKLITENNLVELYLILKDRPALCMKEVSRIKTIAIKLQQVADYCYLSGDMELLKKLQVSLPKEIAIKNKMITDWSSLKKLLSEDPIFAFKLLSNQKLEELISKNSVIELYIFIISIDIRLLTQLHDYPAIQSRISDILRTAHLEAIHPITQVIYDFLPHQYQAHKRLYTLSKATRFDGKLASDSLLALNFWNSGDQRVLDEIERRKKAPKKTMVLQGQFPIALKELYQIISPWLHHKHPYLGLYGSSIRHIYNQKPHNSDYDCFVVLTCSLESIYQLLKKLNFGHIILVKSAKPIIRITISRPEQNPTQIDLSFFNLDTSLEQHQAIQQELQRHDFTISGAYTLINEKASYQIYGTEQTLLALSEKKLSLMQPSRLQEDPLRLMRAIKIHLDDENYEPDEELISIIESRQPQQALADFLSEDLHCRQFVTQLNKVLKSPNQQLLMFELMDKYHFFETWTGFKFEEIKSQLENLPVIDKSLMMTCQLQFIKYLYIVTCLKQKNIQALEATVIYRVTRGFSPTERMFFEFIDNQLMGRPFDMYIDSRDTLQLIEYATKGA